MPCCDNHRVFFIILISFFFLFSVTACELIPPISTSNPSVVNLNETAIMTIETPNLSKTAPASAPTSIPYDPFLKWSEQPDEEVEIHYDFSKMTKEEVKRYLEVNRNDFTVDSEGLHWVVDGKNTNTQNAELTLWPKKGIKNNIANINITKVVIYFSLIKPESYQYFDIIQNPDATFPESTFFSQFECSGPIYPIRILSGANKTWLHSINVDENNPWWPVRSLPEYVRLSSEGSDEIAAYFDWEHRYFITLIPFKYDTKGRPWIKDEYLFVQASNMPFDFSDFITPVDNNNDLFDSDAWKWKGFDCLYPELNYIGFRSEMDSGINATIHSIYILGRVKQPNN